MAEYLLKSISRKVLSSIKVIELEGYPPTSFCGMFLSDYGADVIQISRPDPPMGLPSSHDIL